MNYGNQCTNKRQIPVLENEKLLYSADWKQIKGSETETENVINFFSYEWFSNWSNEDIANLFFWSFTKSYIITSVCFKSLLNNYRICFTTQFRASVECFSLISIRINDWKWYINVFNSVTQILKPPAKIMFEYIFVSTKKWLALHLSCFLLYRYKSYHDYSYLIWYQMRYVYDKLVYGICNHNFVIKYLYINGI